MIKAYHNCTRETAELILSDGMIYSNDELRHHGVHHPCRPSGFSDKDAMFVFLYPDFFQLSEDRNTYRGSRWVAFIFDALKLVEKYNARVGSCMVPIDHYGNQILSDTIREIYRFQGDAAIKRLMQGHLPIEDHGTPEILVPQALPLKDCIGYLDANREYSVHRSGK